MIEIHQVHKVHERWAVSSVSRVASKKKQSFLLDTKSMHVQKVEAWHEERLAFGLQEYSSNTRKKLLVLRYLILFYPNWYTFEFF